MACDRRPGPGARRFGGRDAVSSHPGGAGGDHRRRVADGQAWRARQGREGTGGARPGSHHRDRQDRDADRRSCPARGHSFRGRMAARRDAADRRHARARLQSCRGNRAGRGGPRPRPGSRKADGGNGDAGCRARRHRGRSSGRRRRHDLRPHADRRRRRHPRGDQEARGCRGRGGRHRWRHGGHT